MLDATTTTFLSFFLSPSVFSLSHSNCFAMARSKVRLCFECDRARAFACLVVFFRPTRAHAREGERHALSLLSLSQRRRVCWSLFSPLSLPPLSLPLSLSPSSFSPRSRGLRAPQSTSPRRTLLLPDRYLPREKRIGRSSTVKGAEEGFAFSQFADIALLGRTTTMEAICSLVCPSPFASLLLLCAPAPSGDKNNRVGASRENARRFKG